MIHYPHPVVIAAFVAASPISSTEVGQFGLGIITLFVGWVLNRKVKQNDDRVARIEINTDGRLSDALTMVKDLTARVDQLTMFIQAGPQSVPEPTSKTTV